MKFKQLLLLLSSSSIQLSLAVSLHLPPKSFNGVIALNSAVNLSPMAMVQINGTAISVWISWIVIILTSQDTWSHVSLSTVEIWYILEGCTKWSPGRVVMYSNRLCWPTPGRRYSWFIFEDCRTFKWDIKWRRRLKHCWLCGTTGTFTGGVMSFLFSFFSLLFLSSENISKLNTLHFLC